MSRRRPTAETGHRYAVITASVLGLAVALALRIVAPDTAMPPPDEQNGAGPMTATVTRDSAESHLVHGDDIRTTDGTGVEGRPRVFTVGPSRPTP